MAYELLLPAKDYSVASSAIYTYADAIYIAYKKFGARMYATNFELDEIKQIVNIAHALSKKVFITVNTIIKDSELKEIYQVLDELYLTGADAIISTDFAVINYIINNLPEMECHISTQVGVNSLEDSLFFQNLGAKRVVLARETDIEEIKRIRNNSKIDLEVFIHGALCASVSGSCYISSLLSLRSGNRGRCAQNCRHEYQLYENNKKITDNLFLLSMKDLHVSSSINELVNLKVASFKVEGRMKDKSYVVTLGKYYKELLSGKSSKDAFKIFHRNFTKGFLNNEDRGNILDPNNSSNVGSYIGKVIKYDKDYIYLDLKEEIQIGDRIRFVGKNSNQYITVSEIIKNNNLYKLKLDFNFNGNKDVYKIKDEEIRNIEISNDLIPINLKVIAKVGNKLELIYKNQKFYSENILEEAKNVVADYDYIYNQLAKLNETPFYLDNLDLIGNNFYISRSELNNLRRNLVEYLYSLNNPKREIKEKKEIKLLNKIVDLKEDIYATCYNEEQYEILQELGIKTYFNNYQRLFKNCDLTNFDNVLVANYGDIYNNIGKNITTDYNFNILNSDALINLLNQGVSNVTLAYEASLNDLKQISNEFMNKTGYKAPIDYIVYTHHSLMKLNCCPLKTQGLCGRCKNNNYKLKDNFSEFYLLNYNCNHDLLNGIPLNLIEQIPEIKKYAKRIRLDFTIETKDEIKEIINQLKTGKKTNTNSTKGYYKREIL